MKLKIFYHIINFDIWRTIADEQMGRIFDSGLIDNCELHANLHYNPESYNDFKARWDHPNIIWYNSPEPPEEREHPTFILMQQNALSTDEEFYCLYLHLKGVTHFGKVDENNCHEWRRYLDWFNIVNWRHMVAKLNEGVWDTVGVNRQTTQSIDKNGNERFVYAGNSNWYTASFLRRCLPELKMPREVNYQKQITNGLDYQYDTEYFAGWNGDRGYSFHHANRHHYLQDCPESLYVNFFNNK